MTTEKKAPEIHIVSKLTTKNFGINPKKIAGQPDEVRSMKIGTVYGLADGIKVVEDPNTGTIYHALLGRFQSIHPETGNVTRSAVLYLPGGVHDMYLARVRELEENEVLRLALDINVVRAENPQGYAYDSVDLIPAEEIDPLDEIKQMAAGHTPRSLGGGQKPAAPELTTGAVQQAKEAQHKAPAAKK